MVRPLRLEFAGAIHHVMARGDHREAIYTDDRDREEFVELLGSVCDRFNWTVHAYCLMSNHYHLVVETPDANLGRGMRQLNGVYTQDFNRRHRHDPGIERLSGNEMSSRTARAGHSQCGWKVDVPGQQ